MKHSLRLLSMALFTVALPTVARAQTDTTEYYTTDAIGSVRVIFDAAGTVKARMDYGPFGQQLAPAQGMPRERFGGQETDGESDQANFHARMFQSRTGRFTRSDPVFDTADNPQGWNRHTYAFNNSFRYTDASGLDPITAVCWTCVDFLHFTDSVTVIGSAGTLPFIGSGSSDRQEMLAINEPGSTVGTGGTSAPTTGRGDDDDLPNTEGTPGTPPTTPPTVPPTAPPRPPKAPRSPFGYPSCSSLTIVGNVGEIAIQSPGPGSVSWGVTMYQPIVGFLLVYEEFRNASGKRGRNTSRPYFYAGTGGTVHGSRSGLKSGSEYYLFAFAEYAPAHATGAVTCIVP